MMEPGSADYEYLTEATLDLYTAGYGGTAEQRDRAAKVLTLWDILTELELATPPAWIGAVWLTQEVERARKLIGMDRH